MPKKESGLFTHNGWGLAWRVPDDRPDGFRLTSSKRMKGAMQGPGADEFVVVVEKLLQWKWSKGIQLSGFLKKSNRKGRQNERGTIETAWGNDHLLWQVSSRQNVITGAE